MDPRDEKNLKKILSCVRERSPEGGSDQAKSYQKLAHERDTQKNLEALSAENGVWGSEWSRGASVGDVRGDTDYPQPDMSGLDSGCAYRNEAHPPPHVSFAPSSPDSQGGGFISPSYPQDPESVYVPYPPDPVWVEIRRLDERISWVHANFNPQPLLDEIRGLHQNMERVDVNYGPGGSRPEGPWRRLKRFGWRGWTQSHNKLA